MIFLRKRLKRAKFRGQPFLLSNSDVETGRRIPDFLPAFEDKVVTVQDLGKKEQVFHINGFICGANYRRDSEKLLAACEQSEAGILSHPYLGDKSVVCKSVRMSENSIEGGVIYFSFVFVETKLDESTGFGLQNIPLLGTILGADCLKSATSALNDALDFVDKVPSEMDNLVDSVLAGAENLEKISGPILHTADAMNNIAISLDDLKRTASQIYQRGIIGLANSYTNLRGVIAGKDLGEVDPYNWTRLYPKERFNYPSPVEAHVFFSDQLFVVGIHASNIAPKVADSAPTQQQVKSLEVLKNYVDCALNKPEAKKYYSSLKPIQEFCVDKLYFSRHQDDKESGNPKECLILEAFRRGIGPDELKNKYRSTHPCFPI